MKKSGFSGKIYLLPTLFLFGVVAFVLRALPWKNFVGSSDELLFYGPDCYDHLRRIALTIQNFPQPGTFDSYYGFPVGTGMIWSPLFDYLVAIAVIIIGRGRSDIYLHQVGFWLSPVLAFFTIFAVYAVAKRLFNREAGVTAAFIVAVLPAHIVYSFVSELDHHVAEPLVCIAIMIYTLKFVSPENRSRLGGTFITAMWMVLAILIWRGSIIFWSVALLALALQISIWRIGGDEMASMAAWARRVCILSAVFLLPFVLFTSGEGPSSIKFGVISWFHIIFLVAFALLFFILENRPYRKWLIGVGVIVPLLFYLFQMKAFIPELAKGISVIAGKDPWLDSISELRSMLYPNGKLEIWHSVEMLSFIYWLFPLLLCKIFIDWRKGGYREWRYPLFLVWGVMFWIIPLFRERYVHLTAVTTAIGGGYLFCLLLDRLKKRVAALPACAISAVLILILILPVGTFIAGIPSSGLPDYEKDDLQISLRWLRDNTPATSYYTAPYKQPEYGVLSDWGIGAYVDYLAQRPTLATNFGWETHGLYESAAFLTLSNPVAAEKILEENRIRYLFLNDITGSLNTLRAITEYGARSKNAPAYPLEPFAPLSTMYYRLYIQDGSAYSVQGHSAKAMGHFRLVYESPNGFVDQFKGLVSFYKIFELVPGAVIKGKSEPGTAVRLKILLKSPSQRVVSYEDSTTADTAGEFAFEVPYATGEKSGELVPLGPYAIQTGGRTSYIRVGSSDIREGRTVSAEGTGVRSSLKKSSAKEREK